VAAAKQQAIECSKADATTLLNALKGGYTGTLKDLNDAIVAQAALITVLNGGRDRSGYRPGLQLCLRSPPTRQLLNCSNLSWISTCW